MFIIDNYSDINSSLKHEFDCEVAAGIDDYDEDSQVPFILDHICYLIRINKFNFNFNLFNITRTNPEFELLFVLSDLEKILKSINNYKNFIIDYDYPSISDINIFFDTCNENMYKISMYSRSMQELKDKVEFISKDDLKNIFRTLFNNFVSISEHICISSYNNNLFKDWINRIKLLL